MPIISNCFFLSNVRFNFRFLFNGKFQRSKNVNVFHWFQIKIILQVCNNIPDPARTFFLCAVFYVNQVCDHQASLILGFLTMFTIKLMVGQQCVLIVGVGGTALKYCTDWRIFGRHFTIVYLPGNIHKVTCAVKRRSHQDEPEYYLKLSYRRDSDVVSLTIDILLPRGFVVIEWCILAMF